MEELELPDDDDLATANWLNIMKGLEVGADTKQETTNMATEGTDIGPEVKDSKDSDSNETVKEGVDDAIVDTGTTSQVEGGQGDQKQETNNAGGPGTDESGGDGDTGGAPPGGVIIHTVTPTSPNTAPSQPDRSKPTKRRGPKFKRHRQWRENSTA